MKYAIHNSPSNIGSKHRVSKVKTGIILSNIKYDIRPVNDLYFVYFQTILRPTFYIFPEFDIRVLRKGEYNHYLHLIKYKYFFIVITACLIELIKLIVY